MEKMPLLGKDLPSKLPIPSPNVQIQDAQNEAAEKVEEFRFITKLMISVEGNLIQVTEFFYMTLLIGLVAASYSSSPVIEVAGLLCFCAGCSSLIYAVFKIIELQKLALRKSELQPPTPQVLEQSSVFEANDLTFRRTSAIITTAIGQMTISSKGRQSREAQNIVKVYLANIRLKVVATDVLIIAYEPMFISPLSESAAAVGAGLPVPAAQSGCKQMAELFGTAVSSFKVHDWSLYGGAA